MQKAAVYKPDNHLGRTLDARDAPAAERLVGDAGARLASLREQLVVYVRAETNKVLIYGDAPEDQLFAESTALGEAALSVAEVAGAAGMAGLGEVARGIYSLTNAVRTQGFWHAEAVHVHIGALALLCRLGREDDGTVANQLHAMRRSLGVSD